MALDDSVSKVPLVGPMYARKLEKLGIKSVQDLLYHIPFRYNDYSLMSKIKDLQAGETVTVKGTVESIRNEYTKRGFVLQRAIVADETGKIEVLWFNQRFLTRTIHGGDAISLSGKVGLQGKKLQLEAPEFEITSGASQGSSKDHPLGRATIHTGRLVPVYPETAGVSSKWLRSRVAFVLRVISDGSLVISDFLAEATRDSENLMELREAIEQVHFPDSLDKAFAARRRLAFDELLFAQLETRLRKEEWEKKTVGNKFKIVEIRDKLKTFIDLLPFELTSSQKNAVNEIYKDLASEVPMNRLLQGDVGSGKTVVAALAMLAAYLNGYQAVLMAPTEILAEQHYETLLKLLKSLKIGVGIATSSKKDHTGFDVVVGTHALLSEKLNFKRLGLVVIDEQHRFGVEQRANLTAKGGPGLPHILSMTATPIPRTVALTLYGDLDMSVLSEMPSGRIPVKTWVVPKEKREAAYQWIRKEKTQTFIICPLIEESNVETMRSVRSAKAEYERLKTEVFPDLKLGLLHGKMRAKEKSAVLDDFRRGRIDILVATPVVEVGIDIPLARIIVIEGADRFGLAQLHQLRGRVGRGNEQSYCLLFSENDEAMKRLKYLETLNNGLGLAEVDLKFRGPGERFGTAQHGKWDLKIADFGNLELVERSNSLANKVLQNPEAFPLLQEKLAQSRIKIVPN